MKTGLYPGSFDPITNGHIDIIQRGLRVVDRLIIGIGVSESKTPLLSFAQRQKMINEEISPLAKQQGTELKIVEFKGLLVQQARELGASLILRGLRTAGDFEYEAQMTAMNRVMAPEIETIFLTASPEMSIISSTLVRQIHAMGGDISPFVPKSVIKLMK